MQQQSQVPSKLPYGERKPVVVFGATGNQGGSVARALARSGQFLVRGVTRDLYGQRAKDLTRDGVDVMSFDLNEKDGLQFVMNGAYGVFINTATDFDDPKCLDNEIRQGCMIADYCKSVGIQHVVFSSQLHSANVCSIMARHLVAKAEIESYMRDIGLPLTSLIMPVYYEDICDIFRPRTVDGRNYDIEIPMGITPLDMMSVEDVGPVVTTVLKNRSVYLNKTVSVCGDKILMKDLGLVLTKYLQPRVFKDKQLTVHDFYERRKNELPGCTDWANMFQFFQRVDQRYNLSETKRMNPNLRSFEQWVQEHAAQLNSIF